MPEIKKMNVSILYANTRIIKIFLKTRQNTDDFTWIYLGKDVPFSLYLNELIGGRGIRRNIADLLQATAQETRQEYIDFIGRISSAEKTRYWWLTSISEKNPFISNIFLYFCYINVILKIIENTDKDLIVICESTALMDAIHQNLKGNEKILLHSEEAGLIRVFLSIKNHFVGYIKTVHFLLRWTIRCILAHIFGFISQKLRHGPQQTGKKIIIHSWADNRSFRTPGQYEDVFLGCLGTDLKKKYSGVCYLIDVLPTCFFPVALSKLFRMEENFVLMEEFINPLDVIWSVYSVSTHFPKLKEIPRFKNLDISSIVYAELENDRINCRPSHINLFYIVGTKITRKFEVRSFIYSFENLMWEKMFCLAFREFSPSTAIIGYAHSTISKMETFYTISAYERDIMPLPDTIIVNGLRAQEALINSGFDRHQIVIGGAYRYHTLDITPPPDRKNLGIKNILVISPDDFNATLELVTKTIHAFGNKKEIRCIIKLHPTLPRKQISAYLSGMPDNFIISEKSLDTLLSCVDLVVYTGSTVAVEAMARGIPVLHVRFDLRIDRDIFNERDCITSVSQPEEMYQAFLNLSTGVAGPQKKGNDLVREFFAPVDDRNLSLFLGKNN